MCFFNQFFAKNVSTFTKFEYSKADPVFAMTILLIPYIFRLSAIFFPVEPFSRALWHKFQLFFQILKCDPECYPTWYRAPFSFQNGAVSL